MQIQVGIGFEQLVQLAKKLPSKQWAKLKSEVEKERIGSSQTSDPERFLMSAPTFTESQMNEIEKTRNEISQWRKK